MILVDPMAHFSRKRIFAGPLAVGLLFLRVIQPSLGEPPFAGTIFIEPDIITENDPTAYLSLSDAGQGQRTMFDRRSNDWGNLNAYLFNATFSDGDDIEIQVNPEFSDADSARVEALKYAAVIGRLPKYLRAEVQTVWIHKGANPFGGGNNNLLIHTGQAESYVSSGILEETLVHEACHTSLDGTHANAAGWLEAQNADGEYVSTYARDNPTREDIAESFLLYYAYRYRPDRISQSMANLISSTIPNRIAYFDGQSFEPSATDSGNSTTDSNTTTTGNLNSESNATGSNATGSWLLATDHGAGWRSFGWFGYFYEVASPWVFHSDLGWFYRAGDGTNSIWLYFPGKGLKKDGKPVPTYEEWIAGGKELPADMVFTGGTPWFDESTGQKRQPREVYEMIYGKQGSWMWTEKTTYPYLYDFDAGMWKYFLRSGNSKSLFNYSTGSWESF